MSYYTDCITQIYTQHFPKPQQVERIVQAKQFIATCLQQYYPAGMAASACLSLFPFIRPFKRYYGITLHHYLISVRTEGQNSCWHTGRHIRCCILY